ncbi:MAG: ribonuclease III domain-containing protein [Candidatus Omnitrophota bacterium]|nr:ribonuclease III domain-containing protein [Candidatus Omnitrophota bacterium]
MQTIELENRIGCKFSDKNLLICALTRKALACEKNLEYDQESFCVLGDAIIKAVLCDLLIKNGIETKGQITQKKAFLENEKILAEIGRSMSIHDYMITNEGEKSTGIFQGDRAIAETLEAIIAAVYYDKGFVYAKEVVAFLFADKLKKI